MIYDAPQRKELEWGSWHKMPVIWRQFGNKVVLLDVIEWRDSFMYSLSGRTWDYQYRARSGEMLPAPTTSDRGMVAVAALIFLAAAALVGPP